MILIVKDEGGADRFTPLADRAWDLSVVLIGSGVYQLTLGGESDTISTARNLYRGDEATAKELQAYVTSAVILASREHRTVADVDLQAILQQMGAETTDAA